MSSGSNEWIKVQNPSNVYVPSAVTFYVQFQL